MSKKRGRSFKALVKGGRGKKPAPSQLPIASAAWWKAQKAKRGPSK